MDKTVLALDTATETGWAWRGRDFLHSGCLGLKIKGERHLGDRFHQACERFCNMMVKWKPDLVVYEMVVGGIKAGGNTSLIQKGLEALAQLACARANVPFFDIAAGTIKKWATGDGSWTTTKLEMCDAVVKAYPNHQFVIRKPTKAKPWHLDDNEVDAVWLADLAYQMLEYVGEDGATYLDNKGVRNAVIKKVMKEKWK